MAKPTTDVIDWDEAMQQCGDDEEFLRELLADLRSETETQVVNIEGIIAVRDHILCLCNSQSHGITGTVPSCR
jgi:hypothetical protein